MQKILLVLAAPFALQAAETPLSYAVFAGDPCTTVTIRTLTQQPNDTLRWRPVDGGEWQALTVSHRVITGTGWQVNDGTVSGLNPGQGIEVDDGTTSLGRYRTLRATLDTPLRLAMGGDLMHRPEWLQAECTAIAAKDPDVAVVGGDWSYDNGEIKNFGRWRALFAVWGAAMRRNDGFTVPFIAAIGNHEVRKDGMGPYGALFPEPTARAVDIGSETSILLLDTGHSQPIAGKQTAWLEQALGERRNRIWRFTTYHVPAYPSVREPDDWGAAEVRSNWVPLFERYGVAASFENHDHARKRTHPLIGGKADPTGVLYLGDGCWGVEPRKPVRVEDRPYLAATGMEKHVWLVELSRERAVATAIGSDGQALDRCEFGPRK